MKFIIGLITITSIVSCSNDDDRGTTVIETPNINGVWKPARYESKGKTYPLNDCERKGQLLVNNDLSGVYERYDTPSSGSCNLLDSFSGKWEYDNMNKILTLTYNESGNIKTLKKEVEDFSTTELRILDNTKNLDGLPGNDEASLVFVKQ